MEHCWERYYTQQEEEAYRIYVTDALKTITENTCRFNGGGTMSKRWYDLTKPADTRTAEEIADEVVRKAGLIQKHGGD